MTKITIDKDPIEQAIAGLPPDQIGVSHFALRQKLRAALAEPAVEPDRYAWYQYMDHGNGMGWIERMAAYDPRIPEYAEMYPRIDWVDTKQVRNFRALYTSPPPPAEVPLLTPDELEALEFQHRPSNGPKSTLKFARAIEQAVRQKAGLV